MAPSPAELTEPVPSADRRTRVLTLIVLALPYVAWLYLVAQKAAFGAYNVDDYLYARRSMGLADQLRGGVVEWVSALAHQGPFGPVFLTPASLLAALGFHVQTLGLTQVLFLLVHTAAAWWLLRALAPRASALTIACAVSASSLMPSFLGWATMIHFAVASAAFAVGALAAYANSARLSRLWPSITFGACVGVLSLTRSVSLVYVAALLGAVGVDLMVGASRPTGRIPWRGMGASAASAIVVSIPWWVHSGVATIDHLREAGLEKLGLGATGRSVADMIHFRFDLTLRETGWGPSLVVAALLLVAAWPRADRRSPDSALLAPALFGAFTLIGLSISMNAGTAFSLPATQALVLVGLAGALSRGRIGSTATLGIAAAAVAGYLCLAIWASVPSGWVRSQPGLPWRTLLTESGFPVSRTVSPASASAAVVDAAVSGAEEIVILRDDSAVNVESIRYAIGQAGFEAKVTSWEASGVGAEPQGRTYVLGASKARYQPWIDQADARSVLSQAGLGPRCTFVFSSTNTVELWSLLDLPTCTRAGGSPGPR